jgi:RNA polymerase sigma factor (sigma-70 family)
MEMRSARGDEMTGKVLAFSTDSRPAVAAPDAATAPASVAARDDDDWMLLARSGRPGAFDELVKRHQASVLAVAYRYLGQREAAKDAAQNTFVEVYRRLADYRPQGRFRAYLHRILLNQCRMTVRSRGIRRRFQERLEREEEDAAALPDEQILARERQRQVERALLRLSEKLRAVVVLHFSGELSHADIAEALDIKVGTVKSRLSAALVLLREELEAQ